MIGPFFILMIFSFILLCLFLSERFLLKYAVFQASRKLFVQDETQTLEFELFKTYVYKIIDILPIRKNIDVLSLRHESDTIVVHLKVDYKIPGINKPIYVYESSTLHTQ
ncbi:MAG: hypothetical protein HYS98_00680 [Deltaproteobacteria bacterium]|nr:hypothetical protein [Deltaproteobacteria bacterium]